MHFRFHLAVLQPRHDNFIMTIFTNFFTGIGYFFRSLSILFSNRNWIYFFYPLLIKILLFTLTLVGVFTINDIIKENLEAYLNLNTIPENGHWLSSFKSAIQPHTGWMATIISWLSGLFIFLLLAMLNKYMLLIALSPVLSFASEMAEKNINGKTYPFRTLKFIKDIMRGIIIAVRNLVLEYLLFFAGFLLLILPGAGVILFGLYQIFLLVLSWYFMGFSMMDYSCERHGMGIRESLVFMRKNKWLICGIGSMFWAFITPPFFGDWLGLCFAPAMGAVGASIAFVEIKNSNQHERKEN